MQSVELKGLRLYMVKLEEGDRLPQALAGLASSLGADVVYVVGIGGLRKARIAVFDSVRTIYRYVDVQPLEGHVLEVIALSGNVVCGDGECKPHIHVAVARRPDEVYAGHLVEAVVSPFLELFALAGITDKAKVMELFGARWRLRTSYEPLAEN
ncbi:PPC domain-containing DNA-binding protein [Hyperthermus butylicus]|uniref:Universally conserved protein n=1 Tax=Hyperthermus butylicus (strain DSM 5456 / JCM 9403 / PLM1-5) TaxID=415426 RepID=A2BN70_HYPBU|nr:PPC domain-containing DNA-binding protein [Hyperthermus butylicus]ABM81431.1 universally conserved protein [Hyperthermus butylicus DSM 5456]